MDTGIRFFGILCAASVLMGAAALVLSGESEPTRPEGGVPMVQKQASPDGDGGAGQTAGLAVRPGKFSQSAQALVGDGVMGRATVLVSEPMLDVTGKRPVRSVAIIVAVMEGARLLFNTHELRSMSADGAEAFTFSGSAISPPGESGGDDYSYELLIRPRDGLTWGATMQQGDLTIEISATGG